MLGHLRGEDLLIHALFGHRLEGSLGEHALCHLGSHLLAVVGEQIHVFREIPERLSRDLILWDVRVPKGPLSGMLHHPR